MDVDDRKKFSEFAVWAERSRGLAPTTIKDYQMYLRQAAEYLRKHRGIILEAASFHDLEAFLFSLATAGSRNNARYALVNYWGFLKYAGRAEQNLALGLPKAKERKGLPKPLTLAEVQLLLEKAREHTRSGDPLKWECLITVFIGTGLRLAEVTSLQWQAIQGNVARLTQKGGVERTVFLSSQVLEVLERWRSKSGSETWVFPSPLRPDSPIAATVAYRKVKELGMKAGVEDLHPHRFRHTFATALYEATGDIVKVQKALGHAEIANTMIYTKVNPDGIRKGIEALPFWGNRESSDTIEMLPAADYPKEPEKVRHLPAPVAPNEPPAPRRVVRQEIARTRATRRPDPLSATPTLRAVGCSDSHEADDLTELRQAFDHKRMCHKLSREPAVIEAAHQEYMDARREFEKGLTPVQCFQLAQVLELRQWSTRLSLNWWCWIYLQLGAAIGRGCQKLDFDLFARRAERSVKRKVKELA